MFSIFPGEEGSSLLASKKGSFSTQQVSHLLGQLQINIGKVREIQPMINPARDNITPAGEQKLGDVHQRGQTKVKESTKFILKQTWMCGKPSEGIQRLN